jgi:hypothetical protein
MSSVTPEIAISVVSLGAESVIQGRLESVDGRYAEVSLAGEATLALGSLVELESPAILYLGEIQSSWTQAGTNYVRVLIEHSVDLEKAAAIRRLWDTGVSP